MAIVASSSGTDNQLDADEQDQCVDRRFMCWGRAEAADADKTTALGEASREAKRLRDAQIAQLESSGTGCPDAGCPDDQECQSDDKWRKGNNGSREELTEKQGGLWHHRQYSYAERRMICRCG